MPRSPTHLACPVAAPLLLLVALTACGQDGNSDDRPSRDGASPDIELVDSVPLRPDAGDAAADVATPMDGAVTESQPEVAADASSAEGAVPCEIEDIVRRRCQFCHTRPPQEDAPMALLAWADFHRPASNRNKVIWEQARDYVRGDSMPPPSTPTGALSVDEKSTLLGWLTAGAPAARAACGVDAGTGGG